MSHSKQKLDEFDDRPVKNNKHKPASQRGGRQNKKKLTNDEIMKLLFEQGFGG